MKLLQSFVFVSIFLFIFVSQVQSQITKTTVEDIIKNPELYNTKLVQVEGTITQYVHASSETNTSYYILKGYYGEILKVHTAEAEPEINEKYEVSGILYLEKIYMRNDKVIDSPFLSEKSKQCISCITPPPLPISKTDYIPYYIIGGAVVLIVGFFGFFQVRNRKDRRHVEWESENLTTDYSQIPQKTQEVPPPYTPPYPDEDFKTIKIDTTPSKTVRLIPGQLEIISGEDKGKTFLIQGYQTKEGSIVTIGREHVTGERSHSHIQIDQRYQTVSRKQAEIIYCDKKLYVRNLSETNITAVDGQELSLGQTVELKPNSVIKMGEIEFQYKV